MKASDIMVSPVITVKPTTSIKDLAKLLLEHRISAAPVIDDAGKLVGIVSEGDLIRRSEIGTEWRHSWWLSLISDDEALASDYIKSRGIKVADVMTRDVLTAAPDTPLHEIAKMMEKKAIKRVPIARDGQLVGIVSRANLVQAIASSGSKLDVPLSDTAIRDKLLAHLNAQSWAHTGLLNVSVSDGVVDLWGISGSETERKAIRVAAETTPGVRAVNDHMTVRHFYADA
ncbi:MAG TPA: CBS domain-containing protein [Dongiaceae bacterium]|nr:CBS domain-containing protein [Dongiaceae bacterium]